MTLQETNNFFESLKNQTTKTSEIKVYEKFLHLLTALKGREFSKDEIQSIETELKSFDFESNRENKIKFFKKAFNKFEIFLKDTFSLTVKDYYTRQGIILGSSYGILFGVIFLSSFERSLGLLLGICIGLLIGLTMGKSLDSKAKNESRVL